MVPSLIATSSAVPFPLLLPYCNDSAMSSFLFPFSAALGKWSTKELFSGMNEYKSHELFFVAKYFFLANALSLDITVFLCAKQNIHLHFCTQGTNTQLILNIFTYASSRPQAIRSSFSTHDAQELKGFTRRKPT